MVQHHSWSITEIENTYPFEFQIYVDMLKDYLTKLEEERNKQT